MKGSLFVILVGIGFRLFVFNHVEASILDSEAEAGECKVKVSEFKTVPLVDEGKYIPIKRINGTDLFSGIYYTIGMKRFPKGLVVLLDAKLRDGDAQFIGIDLNPKLSPIDVPKGQWGLEGSEDEGYFVMRNRKLPEAIVSIRKEDVNGYTYFILATHSKTIKELSPGGRDREFVFIKPVGTSLEDFYQLKMKSRPNDSMTWTEKYVGKDTHFIQLSGASHHRPNYQEDQAWYDDTLFSFDHTPLDLQQVSNARLQLGETPGEIMDELKRNTYRVVLESFEIPNNTTVPIQTNLAKVDDRKRGSNVVQLSFEKDFSVLGQLKGSIRIPSLDGEEVGIPFALNEAELGKRTKKFVELHKGVILEDPGVTIPPRTLAKIDVYLDITSVVDLPVNGIVSVHGQIDRMFVEAMGVANSGSKGRAVPELVQAKLVKAGLDPEIMRIVQDSVLLSVRGLITAQIVVGTGSTVEYLKM